MIAEAESRAAEIIRDAEAEAASIREQAEADAAKVRQRGEGDARAQIEAAKRALDELGGTLAAAATAAIPKAEAERQETETQQERPPSPDARVSPAGPMRSEQPPAAPEPRTVTMPPNDWWR